jgi:Holliday junction resolvasome RuvABC endonuclease subunit
MKVIGVKCGKEQLQWAVVEGTCRNDAVVLEHAEAPAPPGDRAEQLEWCRKEVTELVTRHTPEIAAIRVAEAGQNPSAAVARAEMDGVVQAAFAAASVPVRRFYGASVRGAFAAKTRQDTDAATAAVPCVAANAKVRRDQIVVAVATLPN